MDRYFKEWKIGSVDVTNVLLGVVWGLALVCVVLMVW